MALEFHVTLFVMSVVLPSEKMPLAVNDCVWPVAIEAVAGVMTIDVSCAEDTVAVADASRRSDGRGNRRAARGDARHKSRRV